jgi:O-antigen/teichoic acid export membrane protein
VGGVASRGLGLVAWIVVARLLQQEAFGEIGMIQSTIGIFAVFAGVGMGITATKHVAEYRGRDPDRAARLITLSSQTAWAASVVMASALWLLAPWLAEHTLARPALIPALRIASGLLLLGGIQGAQTGTLAGLEAFRTIARLNLITGLISFPLLWVGTWWGGIAGSLWALNAVTAMGCLLNHTALREELNRAGLPRGRAWERQDLPILWEFTLPSALGALMGAAVHWICCSLLVHQPDGYGAMGAFNGANQWFIALLFLPTLLGQSVMPLMAEQLGLAEHRQGRRLLSLSIKTNALVVVPVLVISLLSPWIMGLFGHTFRSEWPTLVVVLLTAALLAIQTPVGQIITASGRVWAGFWMNVGWAIVYLVATSAWVHWGALGLASARLAAYSAHTVWAMWYAFRILRRDE